MENPLTSSQKSDDTFHFMCYRDDGGVDLINAWYRKQAPATRGEFDAIIERLGKMPVRYWRQKVCMALGGRGQTSCLGLWRIKLKDHRILGFLDKEQAVFTMVLVFEKDDDQDYSASCPRAQIRKADIDYDANHRVECIFPEDPNAGS